MIARSIARVNEFIREHRDLVVAVAGAAVGLVALGGAMIATGIAMQAVAPSATIAMSGFSMLASAASVAGELINGGFSSAMGG